MMNSTITTARIRINENKSNSKNSLFNDNINNNNHNNDVINENINNSKTNLLDNT